MDTATDIWSERDTYAIELWKELDKNGFSVVICHITPNDERSPLIL